MTTDGGNKALAAKPVETRKERNAKGFYKWSELSSRDMTPKEFVASLTEKQRKALVELLREFNGVGKH